MAGILSRICLYSLVVYVVYVNEYDQETKRMDAYHLEGTIVFDCLAPIYIGVSLCHPP